MMIVLLLPRLDSYFMNQLVKCVIELLKLLLKLVIVRLLFVEIFLPDLGYFYSSLIRF